MEHSKSSFENKTFLLVGNGGHAGVIRELITLNYPEVKVIVAEGPGAEERLIRENESISYAAIGVGDNYRRSVIFAKLKSLKPDLEFPLLIHPSATVSETAKLGEGTVVMAGAIINPHATIGKHCVVNTGAIVEHDCLLADFVSLATAAAIGGKVVLGERAWIGLGARVLHNVTIGLDTVVGSGAVVTENLPELVIAYGVPAKVIRSRLEEEPFL